MVQLNGMSNGKEGNGLSGAVKVAEVEIAKVGEKVRSFLPFLQGGKFHFKFGI